MAVGEAGSGRVGDESAEGRGVGRTRGASARAVSERDTDGLWAAGSLRSGRVAAGVGSAGTGASGELVAGVEEGAEAVEGELTTPSLSMTPAAADDVGPSATSVGVVGDSGNSWRVAT